MIVLLYSWLKFAKKIIMKRTLIIVLIFISLAGCLPNSDSRQDKEIILLKQQVYALQQQVKELESNSEMFGMMRQRMESMGMGESQHSD